MGCGFSTQSSDSHADLENEADMLLRRAMPTHMDNPHVQISQARLLRNILSKEIIVPLFRQYKARTPSWRKVNIHHLCDEVHENQIIVLALLVLFRKGGTIIQFLENGVSDAKLPLMYTDDACASDLHLHGQAHVRLECFGDSEWTIQMKKDICQMQWHLDVPCLGMGPDLVAKHFDFPVEKVLPWIKEATDTRNHTDKTAIRQSGGYSQVQRVYIHPDYHDFRDILRKIGLLSSSSNYFALKVLNPESDKELDGMYRNEIQHLTNFNGTSSRHLVTLLTSFTHREKRHFLFPWATCDLFTYWDRQQSQPQNLESVRWFSRQLLGLVDAVKTIHWPAHIQHAYGRHGDLKPDNILWYQQYENDPRGILVVSDMGFTVIHRTYSRSKDCAAEVARAPDYHPPELDTKDVDVSRKYDVWTLGCIFLEMLTWFLGESHDRNKFKLSRTEIDFKLRGPTYTFFQLVHSNDHQIEAKVKQSVLIVSSASVFSLVLEDADCCIKCMEEIRRHSNRSQLTDDIVNIIQNRMIIINPSERADMRSLHKDFTDLNDKCQSDSSYCFG
ncbi:kinase-like domain-containing protein [Xylariaceae sp. FL1019]|nr:kinase-like domain-containing protein [Xylariaceae sp. FL1019]